MTDPLLALSARHETLLRQHILLRDMFTYLLPHVLNAIPASERKAVADALAKMAQESVHDDRAAWTMERRAGLAEGSDTTPPSGGDHPPTGPDLPNRP